MDNGENYSRFLSGDKNALEDIVREYMDGLVLYLCSFTDNIVTAEEIAEDTFVKLYADRPSFRGRSTFRTWLYAIGRNTAIDHIRKHKKHREVSADDLYSLSDLADIEREYIRDEERILLRRTMEKLCEDYRQVLYLVYFENFTNSEAGAVMKKSERQIRNLLYRAKKALKLLLEKEGFEYEGL